MKEEEEKMEKTAAFPSRVFGRFLRRRSSNQAAADKKNR